MKQNLIVKSIMFGKTNTAALICQIRHFSLNYLHMRTCGCDVGCIDPQNPPLKGAPGVCAMLVQNQMGPAPSKYIDFFFLCPVAMLLSQQTFSIFLRSQFFSFHVLQHKCLSPVLPVVGLVSQFITKAVP